VLFTDPRNVETIEISDEEKLNDFESNSVLCISSE